MNERVLALAGELGRAALAAGKTIATAESCTAGGISYAITAIPGSSSWFDRGFATYTNESKAELLGVPVETIAARGAVSEEVARAMAEGAVRRSRASMAVSVSGIAGPGGAVPGKPVGTVCMALAWRTGDGVQSRASTLHFSGNRASIREQTIEKALESLLELASES